MDDAAAAQSPKPRLVDLWRHGTKRCRMTPADGAAPFLVEILDGDALVAGQAFDDHHAACVLAIEGLRRAVSPM